MWEGYLLVESKLTAPFRDSVPQLIFKHCDMLGMPEHIKSCEKVIITHKWWFQHGRLKNSLRIYKKINLPIVGVPLFILITPALLIFLLSINRMACMKILPHT